MFCESARPKSNPRLFGDLELIGGGFDVEKRIEDVDDVCDDVGRYSKAGLCGDLEDNDELEYCRSVSKSASNEIGSYHSHLLI